MIKIFSGTSNPKLAHEVAQAMGLGLAQSEVTKFDNSEVRVRIEEDVKHDTCVIIQSTSNPTNRNLMELFLMADALRREEARRVIAMIPYFGYARQDIQHRSGECVSASVIIKFIEAIGIHKVFTYNLHDEATEGVFTIPFKNLSAFPLLAEKIHAYFDEKDREVTPEHIAIVSPDQGGIERARKFGTVLFGHDNFDLVVTEKKRNLDKAHVSKALSLYGDVKDKVAVIIDDVSTSGSTLINSAEFVMEQGAKSTIAAIVHRDFANATAAKIQNSAIEAFFTTDSIALRKECEFEKMQELSVAGDIARVLKEIPVRD